MLALLYDIHGNLPALEAVLDDALGAGADRYMLGGDYAVFGGWPAQTVERLRALEHATWIRGNVDRWAATDAPAGEPASSGIAACRAALDASVIAELGALPQSADLGSGTRAWHASPFSDVRSFTAAGDDDEGELLEGVRERRLVFGHLHVAFERRAQHAGREIELIAPGSVGIPLDGDRRAAYALLHDDGRIERRRVAYDADASAARVRDVAAGAPWGDVIAGRIERAAP